MEDADVETSSEAYARRFSGAVGGWFLAVQADATLDLLRPFPRARIVDVGGGHGQLAAPLAEAGHDVTVVGSTRGLPGARPAPRRRRPGAVPGRRPAAASVRGARVRRRPGVSPAPPRRPLARAGGRAVPGRGPRGDRRLPDAAEHQRHGRPAVRPEEEGRGRHAAVRRLRGRRGRGGVRRRRDSGSPIGARSSRSPWPSTARSRVAALSRGLERAARIAGVTSRLGSPVIVRADRLG